MKSFLQQVAEAYVEREADKLGTYAFVMPNKRSAIFMERALEQAARGHRLMMPRIVTLQEWVLSLSGGVPADKTRLLLMLYGVYLRVLAAQGAADDELMDFERFIYWGDMLAGDFDDVDRFMVDARSLFVNVKRFKEISSNYLTPEQREIISHYWSESDADIVRHAETFWQHTSPDSQVSRRFLRLWSLMLPLYDEYRKELVAEGLTTAGVAARQAAQALKDSDYARSLPDSRYVFVGHGVLTTAEYHIFAALQRHGLADFYWDCTSALPNEADGRQDGALRLVRRNARRFSSLYDDAVSKVDTYPAIEIVGMASSAGQARWANRTLRQWMDDGALNGTNALNTAVVLPDESLLMSLVDTLPPQITRANVTMGYPLRYTPAASLMRSISTLQRRSRRERVDTFYTEDVRIVIDHPVVRMAAPQECVALQQALVSNRRIMTGADVIRRHAPTLAPMFRHLPEDADIDCAARYLYSVLDIVGARLPESSIESRLFDAYRDTVANTVEHCRRYGVMPGAISFLRLIERGVASAAVHFQGMPLQGLQIMGMLETRALDFDNIIVLSMNERILPRRTVRPSFIPDNLRRAYGMATAEHSDTANAYHFYRLLSRASRVTMVYDSRSVGVGSNEMSRYLSRLLLSYADARQHITHLSAVYSAHVTPVPDIVIHKDDRIMALLDRYRTPGGKALSASSLKDYIKCPLSFYLKHVEGVKTDDEQSYYANDSDFGRMVHTALQDFYLQLRGDSSQVYVTAETLNNALQTPQTIERLVTRSVNLHHYGHKDDTTPLTGSNLLLGRLIDTLVRSTLRAEAQSLTPFSFVDAELRLDSPLHVPGVGHINIVQIIDRLDRMIDGRLRITDYKTGSDEAHVPPIPDLFVSDNASGYGAAFQLLFYCHAYSTICGASTDIQPMIYRLRHVDTQGLPPLTYKTDQGRQPLLSYDSVREEFVDQFNSMVAGIFDPDIPFRAMPSDSSCHYCNFKAICNRATG